MEINPYPSRFSWSLNTVCVFSFGKFNNDFYWPFSWQPVTILQHPVFWTTWQLCLPLLNFLSTQGSNLVVNILAWSTDSPYNFVVPIIQFASLVSTWLVWRRKFMGAFFHKFAWGQIFLYLCLPKWSQTRAGIPESKLLLYPKIQIVT